MIRRAAERLLPAPFVLLAACGSSSLSSVASAAPIDSGVHIRVLYGPTCPVQRVGQTCVRPYQATIRILRGPTGRAVETARSDTAGRLSVRLPAGRYLLVPQAGRPFPRAGAQAVIVHAHRFTSVTVNYDSGIR